MQTNSNASSKALIIYKNKILLFLRDNDNSIPDPNTWSLVGGVVDGDESYEQAMLREMQEEISVAPKDTKYLGKFLTQDGITHAIFVSKPTAVEVAAIKLGDEGQKVEFFSFDEIQQLNLATNVKRYFKIYNSYIKDIMETDMPIDPSRLGLQS